MTTADMRGDIAEVRLQVATRGMSPLEAAHFCLARAFLPARKLALAVSRSLMDALDRANTRRPDVGYVRVRLSLPAGTMSQTRLTPGRLRMSALIQPGRAALPQPQ